jgi:hypothetical protein
MQAVGGGYDSADPAVIKQHVAWLEYMGMDAAIIEVTNNVSCIFNSEWFVKKYVTQLHAGVSHLQPEHSQQYGQSVSGMDGARNPSEADSAAGRNRSAMFLIKDLDGKTAFEKEMEYFRRALQRLSRPQRDLRRQAAHAHFLGAAQDPNPADHPLWFRIEQFLQRHPEIAGKYTFKLMAGYLDSQPDLWATQGVPTGPVEISPVYGFWSWVDRLNPTCTEPLCPYYPSYNQAGSQSRELHRVDRHRWAGWMGLPQSKFSAYCAPTMLFVSEPTEATTPFIPS